MAYTDVPAIRGLLYGVQPVVMAIVLDAVSAGWSPHPQTHVYCICSPSARLSRCSSSTFHFQSPSARPPWRQCYSSAGSQAVFQMAGHASPLAPSAEESAAASRAEEHRSLGHALEVVTHLPDIVVVPARPAVRLAQARPTPSYQEMWFFTQAAFVTFGGAYAVLATSPTWRSTATAG